MNEREFKSSKRKALPFRATEPASIPGDPFPWEPDPRLKANPDDAPKQAGVTRSPAQSDDPNSFDLGGGD